MPQIIAAVGAAMTAVAVGIGKALTAFGVSAYTAGVIGGLAVKYGVQIAIVWATSKLLAPKLDNVGARQADVLELSLGEHPREAIFGRAATGGTLMDAFNWGGSQNDWEAMVIALADHECQALVGFYVDDKYVAHVGNGNVSGYSDSNGAALQVFFLPGTMTQTLPGTVGAGPNAMSFVSASGGRWTADDRLLGVAAVIVCYRFTPEILGGRPSFRWVIDGKKCYDPRKDSTVTGGSGLHRWNDPATHEWTENAALCRYNYLRGVYTNGQLILGPGRTAEEAPPEDVIAAANLCDENVTLKAGGTVKRYTVSAVVRADEPWIDVEEAFAAAMGAELIERSGMIVIDPGAAKTVAKTFTDADLLEDFPVEVQAKLSRRDLVNTVTASYVDPAQMYEEQTAPIRRLLADITADGETRDRPLALRFVTSANQAQRLGEIERRKARLQRTANVCLGPRYSVLEVGDWVTWQGSIYNALADRTYMVISAAVDDAQRITLGLREIASSVYSWTPASDELDVNVPSFVAPTPPDGWSTGSNNVLWSDIFGTGRPADNATVNRVFAQASAPAGAVDGDVWHDTDANPQITYYRVGGVWVTGPNLATNTNQLTDGAQLGSTAIWAQVTGTGRPADNATVGARTGVNLRNTADTVTLGDGDVITAQGTAADFTGRGPWATVTTPVGNVLAPGANLFPYPRPPAGSTAAALGWRGGIFAGEWGPVGGRIYITQRFGGAAFLDYYGYTVAIGGVAGAAFTFSVVGHASGPPFTWVLRFLRSDGSQTGGLTYATLDAASGRMRATATGPGDATQIDIFAEVNWPASGAYQDFVFWDVKLEAGAQMTPFVSSRLNPRQDGADITASNTAADFAGRGALATLNTAAWGSHISGRPTELTDGRVAAGLDASGDVARNLTESRLNSSNVLRRSSGGLYTGDLAATVGARAGTNLFRTDGSTVMSQAEVRTAEGTAADFTGRQWGATATEAQASNARVPLGENQAVNSEFFGSFPPLGWVAGWDGNGGASITRSVITRGGRRAIKGAVSNTPANGTVWDIAITRNDLSLGVQRYAMPCKAGDCVAAAARVAALNSTGALVFVIFLDAAGNNIGDASASSWIGAGTNGDSVDVVSWPRSSVIATAPANAASVTVFVRVLASGAASAAAWMAEPLLAILPAGQTEIPPYAPGPVDRLADQTSSNTAADFTGRGPWATQQTPVLSLVAPNPNLFPFPSPIYGIYGGSYPDPSSYGWQGAAIGIGYWQAAGGPIYYRPRGAGGPAADEYHFFDIPNAIAGQPYTVSLNGYMSGGNFYPYVECLNGSKTIISAHPLAYDGTSQRYRVTFTAPANTAFIRLVVLASYPAATGYQDVVFSRIKVEHGNEMTPFSSAPEVTPRQSGADVTGSNTAADFAGRGALATANYYRQASDPGAVPDGSLWTDTSVTPNILKQRISGVWQTLATNNTVAAQLYATVSPKARVKTRSGTGSATTDTVTVTASGGSGGYTYAWTQQAGSSATATAATSATTAFQYTLVGLGEENVTTWECVVTDSAGAKASALVRAVFVETS